jgi:hypothetical protein
VIENDNWGTIYVETEYSLLDYVEEIVDVEKVGILLPL